MLFSPEDNSIRRPERLSCKRLLWFPVSEVGLIQLSTHMLFREETELRHCYHRHLYCKWKVQPVKGKSRFFVLSPANSGCCNRLCTLQRESGAAECGAVCTDLHLSKNSCFLSCHLINQTAKDALPAPSKENRSVPTQKAKHEPRG